MHSTTVKEALLLLLDQVDYTKGNCGPTEMVSAVLTPEVLSICRQAILDDKESA